MAIGAAIGVATAWTGGAVMASLGAAGQSATLLAAYPLDSAMAGAASGFVGGYLNAWAFGDMNDGFFKNGVQNDFEAGLKGLVAGAVGGYLIGSFAHELAEEAQFQQYMSETQDEKYFGGNSSFVLEQPSQIADGDGYQTWDKYAIEASDTDENFFQDPGITQKTPGLIGPAATKACLYLDYVKSVEYYEGRYLSGDQLDELTARLMANGTLRSSDYFVNDATSVIHSTFQALGFANMTGYADASATGASFSILGGFTSLGNYHYQLGNALGNFLWDPLGMNSIIGKVDLIYYVHFATIRNGV